MPLEHPSLPSNPRPAPAEDGPQALGERLRAQRQARAWSLDRAAQETGVSKAMLGQIERGESSPTVATLWKIASGFRCSLTSFIAAPLSATDAASGAVLRSVTAARATHEAMAVAPLFPFDAHSGFEWLEVSFAPGFERVAEPHAAGVTEYLMVIAGQLEVFVDGVWHALAPGEAIRFAADRPHGYRNPGAGRAICQNLIHYAA